MKKHRTPVIMRWIYVILEPEESVGDGVAVLCALFLGLGVAVSLVVGLT